MPTTHCRLTLFRLSLLSLHECSVQLGHGVRLALGIGNALDRGTGAVQCSGDCGALVHSTTQMNAANMPIQHYTQALHNSIDSLLARAQTYVGVVSTRMFTDAKMLMCSLIPEKLQLVTIFRG